MALEEKKLKYTSKCISFESNILQTDVEFGKRVRRRILPVLLDGNILMTESIAILMYLEERYQLHPLMPPSAMQRADVLVKMEETQYLRAASVHVARNVTVENKLELLKEVLCWEATLASSGRDATSSLYLVGNELTMADCAFFPTLALAVRFGLDLNLTGVLDEKHPAPYLSHYYLSMIQRDSVKNTWPPHWSTTSPTQDVARVFHLMPELRAKKDGDACKVEESVVEVVKEEVEEERENAAKRTKYSK